MRDFEDILDSLDLEVDNNSILPPPNTKEVSVCVFCSGELLIDETSPGNCDNEILGYHCSNCGLKYKFLPKQKISLHPPQGPDVRYIKPGF